MQADSVRSNTGSHHPEASTSNVSAKTFRCCVRTVNGKPLVYLDNAASSQVPQVVIDRGSIYLEDEHSNIHRGVHYLSQKATTAYEGAREKVKRFINARDVKECIFVRGATEGINLVMHGYGRKFIGSGDEIIISAMEHHANIVPWQMLCEEKGAKLRVIPMNDAGELLLDEYDALLNERTKLCGSHARFERAGYNQSVKQMIDQAHKYGVPVLIDGAQSAPHMPVDVQDLDCDFFAFLGSQDVCAYRQRRHLRQSRSAGTDESFSGRRRHDQERYV